MEDVSNFVHTVTAVIVPYRGRQGSGTADSGRGEFLERNGEILILVMAGKWRISVFPAVKFVAKFCGKIFVLVLRTFVHQNICHPPPQISPRLWQKLFGLLSQPS